MDKIIPTPPIPFKLNYFDQGPLKLYVQRLPGDGAIFVNEDGIGSPIALCKPVVQEKARKALIEYEFVVELPPPPKDDRIFKDHHDLPRLHLERRIIWNMMKFMVANGWNVWSVHDGEEVVNDKNPVDAMETIFSVDECNIRFRNKAYPYRHSVSIILGNGEDCISDHSIRDDDNFAELMDQFPVEKVRDATLVFAAPNPETLDIIAELLGQIPGNDFPSKAVQKAQKFLTLHGRP